MYLVTVVAPHYPYTLEFTAHKLARLVAQIFDDNTEPKLRVTPDDVRVQLYHSECPKTRIGILAYQLNVSAITINLMVSRHPKRLENLNRLGHDFVRTLEEADLFHGIPRPIHGIRVQIQLVDSFTTTMP